MWLAYLRFDSPDDTRIALVRCGSKAVYEEVLAVAKTFRDWELTEYAVFQAHDTIHARVVPNFAEELIYEAHEFLRRCGVTGHTSPPGRGRRSVKPALEAVRVLELPPG